MNKLLIIVVVVTLLALSAESFRMPRQAAEEEAGTLMKITDTIKSYYDDAINTASGYMDSIRGLKLEEKAKIIFNDTLLGMAKYFSILRDQIFDIMH